MDRSNVHVDPTIAKNLRLFFQSFHRFLYNPANSPEAEFRRLCIQREWGNTNRQKYRRQFEEIFANRSQNRDNAGSSSTQAGTGGGVRGFFQRFEFEGFKFNPKADVRKEFRRLCQMREWGAVKIGNAEREFEQALMSKKPARAAGGAAVERFFKQYEFEQFELNRLAPVDREFERLCQARQWGTKKIAQARVELQKTLSTTRKDMDGTLKAASGSGSHAAGGKETLQSASNGLEGPSTPANYKPHSYSSHENTMGPLVRVLPLSTPQPPTLRPLAAFFTGKQQVDYRYEYQGREPAVEFKLLVQNVEQPRWEKLDLHLRREDCGLPHWSEGPKEKKPQFTKSRTYKKLRVSFYQAVEEEFEEGVQRRAEMAGQRSHEYVLELLGLGKPPISEEDAHNIFRKVNLNIYDFIEYEEAMLRIEAVAKATKMLPAQMPPKPFNYPSAQLLGVYCWVSNRIYPLALANEEGTLKLLLKNVGEFFHKDAMEEVLLNANSLIYKEGRLSKKDATFRVVTKITDWLESGEANREAGIYNASAYLREWRYLFNHARMYRRK